MFVGTAAAAMRRAQLSDSAESQDNASMNA